MEKAEDLADKERAKCNSVAEHRHWKNGGKENEPTQITTAIATIFH
jgi:hypothetical protein